MPYYTAAGIKKMTCPKEPASRPKKLTLQIMNDAIETLTDPVHRMKPLPEVSVADTVAVAFDIIEKVFDRSVRKT